MDPSRPIVAVIIPALDEEEAISHVLAAIPRQWVDVVLVVDNGSTDCTAHVAAERGAHVVCEPHRGYGSAMQRGLAELRQSWPQTDIVVFLDGDASDDPARLPDLVRPILERRVDLVLGSRPLGCCEPGAMPFHSRWGNRVACALIWLLTGRWYTDLGPFRAVRRSALDQLRMVDRDFGWTAEMQVKAARAGLATREVPVPYRRRIGKSKISGRLCGSLRAGWKIVVTILRFGLGPRPRWLPRPPVTQVPAGRTLGTDESPGACLAPQTGFES